MKNLLYSILTIFLYNAQAQELVWNYHQQSLLRSQLFERTIYLKTLIGKKKIEFSEIGRSTSAFYKNEDIFSRNFKDYLGKCFKVDILENYNLAKKIDCIDPKLKISFGGDVYQQIFNFDFLKSESFNISESIASVKVEAFNHQAQEVLSRLNDIHLYPYSEISIDLNISRNVQFTKDYIAIKTNVNLVRSKYSFLSKKQVTTDQDLRIEPKKGDYVFFSDGKLLVYKRYQPSPLDFRFLDINPFYVDYLQAIEDFFFQHQSIKRCFRDNLLRQNQHDCDLLIFNTKSNYSWRKFNLIQIDLSTMEIKLI